jgi:hypothetical protein
MATPSAPLSSGDSAFINIRKLAALDMVFHGRVFILAEFSFGVFFSVGLGAFLTSVGFFVAWGTLWQGLLGCYVLCIALNYVPLFIYAIRLAKHGNAREVVAFELEHKAFYARKYTLQSLLLLLPLVVPILALYQERQPKTTV